MVRCNERVGAVHACGECGNRAPAFLRALLQNIVLILWETQVQCVLAGNGPETFAVLQVPHGEKTPGQYANGLSDLSSRDGIAVFPNLRLTQKSGRKVQLVCKVF